MDQILSYLVELPYILNDAPDIIMLQICFFLEVFRIFLGSVICAIPTIFGKKENKEIALLRAKGAKQAIRGVSVVAPAHNNPTGVMETVLSLRNQSINRIQIIIINDGSNDETDKVCQELRRSKLIDVYVKLESRTGKASATNTGFNFVKYPFTVFCDTGTTFHYDALEIALSHFEDKNVMAVAAHIGVRNPNESLISFCQRIEYLFSLYIVKNQQYFWGFAFIISGAIGLFRTDTLKLVGGYAQGTAEDLLTSLIYRNLNFKVAYSPYAKALTDVPTTLGALCKQRHRWARSNVYSYTKKFACQVLNPFSSQFSFSFAFGVLDIILRDFLNLFIWFILFRWFFYYGIEFLPIFVAFYAIVIPLYIINSLFIIMFENKEDRDWKIIFYIPLYCLYETLLMIVRAWSYYSEIIGNLYFKEEYLPKKVQHALRKLDNETWKN